MKRKIVTLGCRLNRFESEAIRQMSDPENHADTKDSELLIVNSCAVTNEAVRQTRQTIRKLHRDNPAANIIVTGCAATLNPEKFAAMEGVAKTVANRDKLNPAAYRFEDNSPIISETKQAKLKGFGGKARAFLQIQNGCNHSCTFCIIPQGRGPSYSLTLDDIIDEARNLVEEGVKEIILTGVDLTAYGQDLDQQCALGDLVRTLLQAVPGLLRLRLSSLDCSEIDEVLFAAFAEEERLMPHVHLSLQAGDDLILKRMKRRHLFADACHTARRLRELRPDIVLGADLITGFPTESDERFQRTLDLVEECGLTFLHVFPFSARDGTPAARIPDQVPVPVRKERAARLRALGSKQVDSYMSHQLGREEAVLIESNGCGHSPAHAPVRLVETGQNTASFPEDGALVQVQYTGKQDGYLLGRFK